LGGKNRKWLYSFVGGYQPTNYLTDVRGRIFAGVHGANGAHGAHGAHGGDVYIKNTGAWFFNNVVYSRKQNAVGELNEGADKAGEVDEYMSVMADSRWALCPGGSGPSSIRFWEALALGSIPVLLSDTMDLPVHELWEDAIVRVPEADVGRVREILESISAVREQNMRDNCVRIYGDLREDYRGDLREDYRGSITQVVHYCCDTFETGAVGGVARYDYQIKLAFPNRRFFKGPQHKVHMLAFLEQCGEVVVITDNHLACDIPNKYRCLLVHHGVAQIHAEREPEWNGYWKELCCNGQMRMLDMRDPFTTDIISISQFCTDGFTRIYGEKYTKFNRIPVLHPSELDENRYKKKWNRSPIVLGNWGCINKGKKILPILKNKITNFNFQQLDVRIDNRGIENFNKRKQKIYLDADIFLQISNSEGNSYATLDALICGLVVVASNVGLFYADIPEDCFVKIDWERNGDAKYVEEKLRYAWDNRVELGKNAREWYMKNCRLSGWIEKMREIV
jgi:glycosyltransferase involved in cell wall biosynthesis